MNPTSMIDDVLIPLRPVTDFDKLLFAQAAIKDMKKKYAHKDVEIGQLKSEIDRLEDELARNIEEKKELHRNLNDISLAARNPDENDYKRRYLLIKYRLQKVEKRLRAMRLANNELVCKLAKFEMHK